MIALAIIAAQAADLLTFLLAVKLVGIGAESNPVAAGIYGMGGSLGIVLFKALIVALYLLLLSRLHRYRKQMAVLAVVVGMLGAVANTAVAL